MASAGRPKGSKQHPFKELLTIAVNEPCEDDKTKKKLRRMAEKLTDLAVRGEPWAIKEVADRLDGKPQQAHQLEHDATDRFAQFMANLDGNSGKLVRD